jgi:hypothetical protein
VVQRGERLRVHLPDEDGEEKIFVHYTDEEGRGFGGASKTAKG